MREELSGLERLEHGPRGLEGLVDFGVGLLGAGEIRSTLSLSNVHPVSKFDLQASTDCTIPTMRTCEPRRVSGVPHCISGPAIYSFRICHVGSTQGLYMYGRGTTLARE